MKKVIFKSALLAVVSVAMMATTSQALTITAFDAETNQTNIINDNGTGDINALEGMITTNNFFMGGWDFSNVTATSTPIIGTESDPVLNAFSINTNYLGQDGDLTLTVADDFTGPLNPAVNSFLSVLNGTLVRGDINLGYTVTVTDTSNNVWTNTIAWTDFDQGPWGAFSTSLIWNELTYYDFSGAYTIEMGMHLTGKGAISFDATTSAPVPEPATMLLFGTGLAGLAGFSRKKSKKA